MELKYRSTRGGFPCSGAEAIRSGIASDGGLFVPVTLPAMDLSLVTSRMSYVEMATAVLGRLLPDYSMEELKKCSISAYGAGKFDNEKIVPLVRVGQRTVLELWHGPTSAFKDMALQIMPHLLTLALSKTKEEDDILILVATSGDTGKAALDGFRDVARTNILVFYPSEGVSDVQRRQMATQEGRNVGVVAVDGNFDDAQTGVKKIFGDAAIRSLLGQKKLKLSSANSINWGRLAPQISYYFSAYSSLCAESVIKQGDLVNFCVPTGNFGNILAGYYAKKMGLPVGRLLCASNDNNVLTDFLRTGVYDRNRSFHQTVSPSMDILISSNLERLLYHATGGDSDQIRSWMEQLSDRGRYEVDKVSLAEIQSIFWADWCSEAEALDTVRTVWDREHYLMDTHTAVAWKVAETYENTLKDGIPTVVLSTASPFKFADSVLHALGNDAATLEKDPMKLLKRLSDRTGRAVPTGLAELEKKPIRHSENCKIDMMPDMVEKFVAKIAAQRKIFDDAR